MFIYKRLITTLLLIFTFSFVLGQDPVKMKEDADKLFEQEKFLEAFPIYQKVLTTSPKDPDINFKFGVCIVKTSSKKMDALKYLNIAIQNPSVNPEAFYYLGLIQHLNFQFNDASINYQKYKEKSVGKLNKELQVDRQIQMCQNGKELISTFNELVVQEKTDIEIENFYRIYNLNNIGGTILVYADFQSKVDKKRNHIPVIHFPKDKSIIYYSSYGESEDSGLDIYVRRKLPDGSWALPQKVQGGVNTDQDEDFPFIQPSSGYLYFSSKGHNSMGGFDVFRSKINPESNTFGEPENMDFAISSPANDMFYVVDSLNKNAYFSSDRQSKSGKITVYKVKVDRIPTQIAVIKGDFQSTINPENKKVYISVKDFNSGKDIGKFKSDNKGVYLLTFPKGGKYEYTIRVEGNESEYKAIVTIPFLKEFKPLKQKILNEVVAQNEVVRVVDLFDEEVDDPQSVIAFVIKSQSELNPNASTVVEEEETKLDNRILVELGLDKYKLNEISDLLANEVKEAEHSEHNIDELIQKVNYLIIENSEQIVKLDTQIKDKVSYANKSTNNEEKYDFLSAAEILTKRQDQLRIQTRLDKKFVDSLSQLKAGESSLNPKEIKRVSDQFKHKLDSNQQQIALNVLSDNKELVKKAIKFKASDFLTTYISRNEELDEEIKKLKTKENGIQENVLRIENEVKQLEASKVTAKNKEIPIIDEKIKEKNAEIALTKNEENIVDKQISDKVKEKNEVLHKIDQLQDISSVQAKRVVTEEEAKNALSSLETTNSKTLKSYVNQLKTDLEDKNPELKKSDLTHSSEIANADAKYEEKYDAIESNTTLTEKEKNKQKNALDEQVLNTIEGELYDVNKKLESDPTNTNLKSKRESLESTKNTLTHNIEKRNNQNLALNNSTNKGTDDRFANNDTNGNGTTTNPNVDDRNKSNTNGTTGTNKGTDDRFSNNNANGTTTNPNVDDKNKSNTNGTTGTNKGTDDRFANNNTNGTTTNPNVDDRNKSNTNGTSGTNKGTDDRFANNNANGNGTTANPNVDDRNKSNTNGTAGTNKGTDDRFANNNANGNGTTTNPNIDDRNKSNTNGTAGTNKGTDDRFANNNANGNGTTTNPKVDDRTTNVGNQNGANNSIKSTDEDGNSKEEYRNIVGVATTESVNEVLRSITPNYIENTQNIKNNFSLSKKERLERLNEEDEAMLRGLEDLKKFNEREIQTLPNSQELRDKQKSIEVAISNVKNQFTRNTNEFAMLKKASEQSQTTNDSIINSLSPNYAANVTKAKKTTKFTELDRLKAIQKEDQQLLTKIDEAIAKTKTESTSSDAMKQNLESLDNLRVLTQTAINDRVSQIEIKTKEAAELAERQKQEEIKKIANDIKPDHVANVNKINSSSKSPEEKYNALIEEEKATIEMMGDVKKTMENIVLKDPSNKDVANKLDVLKKSINLSQNNIKDYDKKLVDLEVAKIDPKILSARIDSKLGTDTTKINQEENKEKRFSSLLERETVYENKLKETIASNEKKIAKSQDGALKAENIVLNNLLTESKKRETNYKEELEKSKIKTDVVANKVEEKKMSSDYVENKQNNQQSNFQNEVRNQLLGEKQIELTTKYNSIEDLTKQDEFLANYEKSLIKKQEENTKSIAKDEYNTTLFEEKKAIENELKIVSSKREEIKSTIHDIKYPNERNLAENSSTKSINVSTKTNEIINQVEPNFNKKVNEILADKNLTEIEKKSNIVVEEEKLIQKLENISNSEIAINEVSNDKKLLSKEIINSDAKTFDKLTNEVSPEYSKNIKEIQKDSKTTALTKSELLLEEDRKLVNSIEKSIVETDKSGTSKENSTKSMNLNVLKSSVEHKIEENKKALNSEYLSVIKETNPNYEQDILAIQKDESLTNNEKNIEIQKVNQKTAELLDQKANSITSTESKSINEKNDLLTIKDKLIKGEVEINNSAYLATNNKTIKSNISTTNVSETINNIDPNYFNEIQKIESNTNLASIEKNERKVDAQNKLLSKLEQSKITAQNELKSDPANTSLIQKNDNIQKAIHSTEIAIEKESNALISSNSKVFDELKDNLVPGYVSKNNEIKNNSTLSSTDKLIESQRNDKLLLNKVNEEIVKISSSNDPNNFNERKIQLEALKNNIGSTIEEREQILAEKNVSVENKEEVAQYMKNEKVSKEINAINPNYETTLKQINSDNSLTINEKTEKRIIEEENMLKALKNAQTLTQREINAKPNNSELINKNNALNEAMIGVNNDLEKDKSKLNSSQNIAQVSTVEQTKNELIPNYSAELKTIQNNSNLTASQKLDAEQKLDENLLSKVEQKLAKNSENVQKTEQLKEIKSELEEKINERNQLIASKNNSEISNKQKEELISQIDASYSNDIQKIRSNNKLSSSEKSEKELKLNEELLAKVDQKINSGKNTSEQTDILKSIKSDLEQKIADNNSVVASNNVKSKSAGDSNSINDKASVISAIDPNYSTSKSEISNNDALKESIKNEKMIALNESLLEKIESRLNDQSISKSDKDILTSIKSDLVNQINEYKQIVALSNNKNSINNADNSISKNNSDLINTISPKYNSTKEQIIANNDSDLKKTQALLSNEKGLLSALSEEQNKLNEKSKKSTLSDEEGKRLQSINQIIENTKKEISNYHNDVVALEVNSIDKENLMNKVDSKYKTDISRIENKNSSTVSNDLMARENDLQESINNQLESNNQKLLKTESTTIEAENKVLAILLNESQERVKALESKNALASTTESKSKVESKTSNSEIDNNSNVDKTNKGANTNKQEIENENTNSLQNTPSLMSSKISNSTELREKLIGENSVELEKDYSDLENLKRQEAILNLYQQKLEVQQKEVNDLLVKEPSNEILIENKRLLEQDQQIANNKKKKVSISIGELEYLAKNPGQHDETNLTKKELTAEEIKINDLAQKEDDLKTKIETSTDKKEKSSLEKELKTIHQEKVSEETQVATNELTKQEDLNSQKTKQLNDLNAIGNVTVELAQLENNKLNQETIKLKESSEKAKTSDEKKYLLEKALEKQTEANDVVEEALVENAIKQIMSENEISTVYTKSELEQKKRRYTIRIGELEAQIQKLDDQINNMKSSKSADLISQREQLNKEKDLLNSEINTIDNQLQTFKTNDVAIENKALNETVSYKEERQIATTNEYNEYAKKAFEAIETENKITVLDQNLIEQKEQLQSLIKDNVSNPSSEKQQAIKQQAQLIKSTEIAKKELIEQLQVSKSQMSSIIAKSPENGEKMKNMALRGVSPISAVELVAKASPIPSDGLQITNTPTQRTVPIPVDVKEPTGLVYRVQVGAFSKPIPEDLFSSFNPVSGEKIPNTSITRYMAGYFNGAERAVDAKNKIKNLGYKDAFVIAYCDGKRISLAEARDLEKSGRCIPKGENELMIEVAQNTAELMGTTLDSVALAKLVETDYHEVEGAVNAIQVEKRLGLFYSVQVGVYHQPVNAETLKNIDPVVSKRLPNGQIRYSSGMFHTVDAARPKKEEAVQRGIADAFITAYYKGERITLNEAKALIDQNGTGILEPIKDNESKVYTSEEVQKDLENIKNKEIEKQKILQGKDSILLKMNSIKVEQKIYPKAMYISKKEFRQFPRTELNHYNEISSFYFDSKTERIKSNVYASVKELPDLGKNGLDFDTVIVKTNADNFDLHDVEVGVKSESLSGEMAEWLIQMNYSRTFKNEDKQLFIVFHNIPSIEIENLKIEISKFGLTSKVIEK